MYKNVSTKKTTAKTNSTRGQGMVSVIVASAVGAIVIGFLTDMLVQQGISQKFITQKLEINDLTTNLMTTFSKSNNCRCQFSSDPNQNPNHANFAANLKFNVAVTDGSQVINVKKIYAGCKDGAQMPPLIAEEGQPLPNSSSLRVDKVEFVNLKPTGSTDPTEWQGQWRISFQVGANSAIRSVRPVLVTQKVNVNPNGANTTIINCSGLSSGSGTLNFLAKWSPIPGVLEDSTLFEDGSTGNLGIGTTTPINSLTIQGDGSSTNHGSIVVGRTSDPALPGEKGSIVSYNVGTDKYQTMDLGAKDFRFFTAADNTGAPNGPLGMFIQNTSGHVGIGTTNPRTDLHVDGIGIFGDLASTTKVVAAATPSARPNPTIYGWDLATNNHAPLELRSTPGAQLYLETNGSIGVGTTTPQVELHVATSTGNADIATEAGAFKWTMSTVATDGMWSLNRNIPGDLPTINVTQSGNVGIGTQTPQNKMDVNGAIKVGNDTSACDSNKAGSIRWNGSAFQGCNGTAWVSLGGIGGGTCTTTVGGQKGIVMFDSANNPVCAWTNGACGGSQNCINAVLTFTTP